VAVCKVWAGWEISFDALSGLAPRVSVTTLYITSAGRANVIRPHRQFPAQKFPFSWIEWARFRRRPIRVGLSLISGH